MKHLHPLTVFDGFPEPLGVSISDGHINIAVLAPAASDLFWCAFDPFHVELARVRLPREKATRFLLWKFVHFTDFGRMQ